MRTQGGEETQKPREVALRRGIVQPNKAKKNTSKNIADEAFAVLLNIYPRRAFHPVLPACFRLLQQTDCFAGKFNHLSDSLLF